MKWKFTFNKNYFALTILFFAIEVVIALYVHDAIVRPYIGDLLVVVLLYCCIRAFCMAAVIPAITAALGFAFLVELSQYFNLVTVLGLDHSKLAKVVLGSSFEWLDLLAYTAGAVIIAVVEYGCSKSLMRKTGRT